jgi:hypothetical protein
MKKLPFMELLKEELYELIKYILPMPAYSVTDKDSFRFDRVSYLITRYYPGESLARCEDDRYEYHAIAIYPKLPYEKSGLSRESIHFFGSFNRGTIVALEEDEARGFVKSVLKQVDLEETPKSPITMFEEDELRAKLSLPDHTYVLIQYHYELEDDDD